MTNNLTALLDTISVSEGTKGVGDDGYNVLVGGDLFHSYADHPRVLVDLGRGLKSTAAGRYQILARYYDAYKKLLNLEDFSPASQDAIAIQMIREHGALEDIGAGRFELAINKICKIWASLPGAGYSQHENHLSDLKLAYVQSGGVLSEA